MMNLHQKEDDRLTAKALRTSTVEVPVEPPSAKRLRHKPSKSRPRRGRK